MQHINLEPVADFAALGRRWEALEPAADGGFFRSWMFLGCLAAERFAGATLLSVVEDGVDVALALLGRGQGRSWLNQTGRPADDAVFIEWNGLLVRRGREQVVAPALAHAARAAGPVALSGVDPCTLAAARRAGWLEVRQTRVAPCINLAGLQGDFLARLSPNTRGQIRRSMRLFGAGLRLSRAETRQEAHEIFQEMVRLHQISWQARGREGAFADAAMLRFHAAMIDRAWPSGHLDLLRIAASGRHLGTLYMFVHGGRAMNYQSGFCYGPDKREKPGLVCHALAASHYAERGLRIYDFLAGDQRYKKSLADGGHALHWGVLHRRWSLAGGAHALLGALRRAPS